MRFLKAIRESSSYIRKQSPEAISEGTMGLFALHRKIWFGVCKKIENFVITNFLFS